MAAMGRVRALHTVVQATPTLSTSPRPPTQPRTKITPPARTATPVSTAAQDHRLGVGLRFGGYTFGLGLGVEGRYRVRDHLGMQATVAYFSEGGSEDGVSGSGSILIVAPSALYLWPRAPSARSRFAVVEPYAGGGLGFIRVAASARGYGESASASGTKIGFQVFGGIGVSFKSLPKLRLSNELGFLHFAAGAAGIGVSGSGLAISSAAHWYFK